ncbi:uncharacterized protein HGUI_03993 [Hanseniaspora guilliermondii]|uniref:Uncharacterized protein n=1 Tax=Hanseniaspora guilliermondii TaxID=56406 RepID=A0A1L0B5F4_9ASCO|nr:uncharacterized protein HGUI_03993 [Hanseniaspora guilliermondii]
MGFKLPSIQELKLQANISRNENHSDSNRTEIDVTEHDNLSSKQNSLQNSHLLNSTNQPPIQMAPLNNMHKLNGLNSMNPFPKDNMYQMQQQPVIMQQPMYQNIPQMNSMIMPPNQQLLNYNNMLMVPQYYVNPNLIHPNYMFMNPQQYYNVVPNNYMMNPNMQQSKPMTYTPQIKQENKINKVSKKPKQKKNILKGNEPCIEYEINNKHNKRDIDIIEKVKRSLLKNRQGRPITLDLSINATLYESLNDYILHYLRKNFNLDYWYSQDINLDSISYMNGGDKEITEITEKLKKDINLDNLKENDSIVINNLDTLKFLYLEKSNIESKNFNFKVPIDKSKVVIDPTLDEEKCFPQTESVKEYFGLDIYKKIEMKPHGNYVDHEDSESRNNSMNNENICSIKKSQILYTVKDSSESILPELKRRMRLKPDQKFAILKQYKKNMLAKTDNKGKAEPQSAMDSKVVMFDYIPIINEHEINIEFFKKIICYPKYRTNYELILIKRDNSFLSMNHQIRCYLDKDVYLEKLNDYKSITDNLYGYYIMKDINTALTGTMMSNYNGDISFQTYMKFNQQKKFMSKTEDGEPYKKHSVSLKGEFKTLPSGVEYFERKDESEENVKLMCYDLWVLDLG